MALTGIEPVLDDLGLKSPSREMPASDFPVKNEPLGRFSVFFTFWDFRSLAFR